MTVAVFRVVVKQVLVIQGKASKSISGCFRYFPRNVGIV